MKRMDDPNLDEIDITYKKAVTEYIMACRDNARRKIVNSNPGDKGRILVGFMDKVGAARRDFLYHQVSEEI